MATTKKVVKKAAAPAVEKLAIDGGKKVWSKGFPAWPQFNPKTDKKVLDILHSGKVNYWTGPVGMQFEAAWAKWLGVKNAISVSNGTAALHVALTALGIGSGDEVICTSYSFIASSFCALQRCRCSSIRARTTCSTPPRSRPQSRSARRRSWSSTSTAWWRTWIRS